MEITDYINKNLTNLNWNILPQIFEENDVELTEEIEAYLRNTPENTNWNVFDGMSGSGEEKVIFEGDYNFVDSGSMLSINLSNQSLLYPANINKTIQINIDGLIYSNTLSQLSPGSKRTPYYIGAMNPGDTAGIVEHKVGAMFSALNDSTEIDQINYIMLDKAEHLAGTYHVKIELLN